MQNIYFGDKTILNWKTFSQWLILWGIVLGRYGVLIALLLFLVISIFYFKRFYPLGKAIVFLILIGIVSLVQITKNNYEYEKFMQQISLISIYVICYAEFFQYQKENLTQLWDKYIKISFWVSIIGLIQFVVFYFTFVDIFDNGFGGEGRFIRIHSFFQEAGNLATFLTPCTAYILFSKEYRKKERKQSLIVLLTYLLTFTTIAYFIGVLIVLYKLLMKYNKLKYILIFPIIILSVNFLESSQSKEYDNKNFLDVIQLKLSQTINAFENFSPYDFEFLNASSYATLTNLWVAQNAPERFIGTGLGTHEISYERLYKSDYRLYGLNKDDAYSLITRIYSEFGLVGLIMFAFFLKKYYRKNNIVVQSLLFIFVSMGIRGGHYFAYGVIFFVFLFIYSAKNNIIYEKVS